MHNINLLKQIPKQLYQSQYQLPQKIRMSMSFSLKSKMFFYFHIFIYLYTGIYYKPGMYAIYEFNMQHIFIAFLLHIFIMIFMSEISGTILKYSFLSLASLMNNFIKL